ncbi:MAG TPA: heme-copper oxidase subunit III [bacterium]|nr:heme-copper oxidase subunit III [bacterium]
MESNPLRSRSSEFGMLLFLAAEAMFFAGLVSAYWVLRAQVLPWPPAGQPRLPVAVTGVNTVILLLSGLALWRSRAALKKGCRLCVAGSIGLAGLGGLVFLGVQGYEWSRLIRFGLTTVRNIYGGLFYAVIGAHAVHVVAGLCLLLFCFFRAVRGAYTEEKAGALAACRMYWLFVVAVWPVLYAIVYLY